MMEAIARAGCCILYISGWAELIPRGGLQAMNPPTLSQRMFLWKRAEEDGSTEHVAAITRRRYYRRLTTLPDGCSHPTEEEPPRPASVSRNN